jgi:hypothetical protein
MASIRSAIFELARDHGEGTKTMSLNLAPKDNWYGGLKDKVPVLVNIKGRAQPATHPSDIVRLLEIDVIAPEARLSGNGRVPYVQTLFYDDLCYRLDCRAKEPLNKLFFGKSKDHYNIIVKMIIKGAGPPHVSLFEVKIINKIHISAVGSAVEAAVDNYTDLD